MNNPSLRLAPALALALAFGLAACSQQPTREAPAGETPAAAAAPSAQPMALQIKDASGAALSGTPAEGMKQFGQCRTCHAVVAGRNLVGPSLSGIVGRKAGTVEGFKYSEANRTSGVVWSDQELFTYLEDPKARIPGTTMAFFGIKDAQARADLVSYLKGI